MSDIEIRKITKENADALALPNDPFLNTGLVLPRYDENGWSYSFRFFSAEEVTEDCFPDEHYVFEEMGENFYGLAAYADGECAGFALLFKEFGKFLYLDNLLVPAKYRRQGVGSALVRASLELAKELSMIGVKLVCQDNNLQAAQFYFANGFELGGVDTRSYDGTRQEGKKDLYLYLKY